MSIETSIDRLSTAIEALLAHLQAAPAVEVAPAPAKAARGKTGRAITDTPEQREPQPAPEPALEPVKVEAPAPEPAKPVELDYARDVQQPALALVAAKGREALVAVLAQFNAKTAKEIPAAQWPALAAAIAEAAQ